MKRLPFSFHFFLIVCLLILITACERSLQTETATPTVEGVVTVPAILTPTTQTAPVQPPAYPVTGEPVDGAATVAPPAGEGTAVLTPEASTTEPAPQTTAGPSVHSVQAGETLGQIAQIYGVSVNDIAVANNITDINTLDVGQQLVIPAPGSGDNGAPQTGEQQYIVQAGDTLFQIGLRYGVTIEELTAYNNLADPNDLEVGQLILIPPGG